MTPNPSIAASARFVVAMLAMLLLGIGSATYSPEAQAQVICLPGDPDADGDGLCDALESAGITTIGVIGTDGVPIGQRTFPRCAATVSAADRLNCVDPASKDMFVIYVPTATGSFLAGAAVQGVNTAIPNPFAAQTVYGTAFNGFTTLGVTVHVLRATEAPLGTRQVSAASAQKAVTIFEDLDNSDLNTLGYCPWGRPNVATQGECIVYTRRIWDSIPLACGNNLIYLPGSTTVTVPREEVFKAYTIELILHEVGHSVGGLAPVFNSSYGGYHYGPGTIMEQYVVATVSKGRCRFAVSKAFNSRNDPPAVNLK